MESAIPIDVLELCMPITLRPCVPVTDEQLMHFSERNRPYRIERNKQGEITIMTPVTWLMDPQQEIVTIYTPLHDPEILDKPETVLGTDPVAGFELHCSEIWASKS